MDLLELTKDRAVADRLMDVARFLGDYDWHAYQRSIKADLTDAINIAMQSECRG